MSFKDFFILTMQETWKLFITPWTNSEILWVILPLVLILILIHIYFGRYRNEELGWNSAFGNAISLLWICVILFRFLFHKYNYHELTTNIIFLKSFAITSIMTLWVISLLAFNFLHKLPKQFAYLISSADSVYILAYIAISMVMGEINITNWTFAGAIVLFIFLHLLLEVIRYLTPMSTGSKISKSKKKNGKKKKPNSK